jgi:hypothetical protein
MDMKVTPLGKYLAKIISTILDFNLLSIWNTAQAEDIIDLAAMFDHHLPLM